MARQKSDDGRHMKGWTLCQKKTLLSLSLSLSLQARGVIQCGGLPKILGSKITLSQPSRDLAFINPGISGLHITRVERVMSRLEAEFSTFWKKMKYISKNTLMAVTTFKLEGGTWCWRPWCHGELNQPTKQATPGLAIPSRPSSVP